jgi:hypothetical protein
MRVETKKVKCKLYLAVQYMQEIDEFKYRSPYRQSPNNVEGRYAASLHFCPKQTITPATIIIQPACSIKTDKVPFRFVE